MILCSDHGQTEVHSAAPLESAYADLRLFRGRGLRADVAVCASNRAGQVYRLPGCREETRALAERLDGHEAVDVVFFREDDARRRQEGPGRGPLRPGRSTPLRAPGPRSPTRTRATCSSRRGRAGSSPTSAGAITPAGAATGRSAPATRRSRCLRSGSRRRPRASPRSRRPSSPGSRSPPVSPDELAAARRRMVDEQLRGRDIRDERVLAAMGRVPRELFVPQQERAPRVRGRRPADRRGPDDLPAVHGRPHLRGARAARGRARARRRYRLRLPGRGARGARGRGAHDRASAGLAEPRRAALAAAGYERVTCTSATARSACPGRRRSPRSPSRRGAGGACAPLYEQLEPGGRLVVPVGGRERPGAAARRAQPGGPRR